MNPQQIFNGWRAMAYTYYGEQYLLYMGPTPEQVKKHFTSCFYELLSTGEQMGVNRISIENWHGTPEKGFWVTQEELKVPKVERRIEIAY